MKMLLGILICHDAVWLVQKTSEALPVFSAVIRFAHLEVCFKAFYNLVYNSFHTS